MTNSSGPTIRQSVGRIAAPWLSDPALQAVFQALAADGHVSRAVGGAVRDTIRTGARTFSSDDIDLATTARPDETIAAAEKAGLKAVPTGIDHGTITVIVNEIPFEVTTLRSDLETDGRRATVAFTGDWQTDAERRDFTVNAIYCDADGTLFDPVGGLADIAHNRLRFIGSADERIHEDYLRILRLFRFIARFDHADVDAKTLRATTRGRDGLMQLSRERIWSELKKILAADNAGRALGLMLGYGLFDRLGIEAPRVGLVIRFEALARAGQMSQREKTLASFWLLAAHREDQTRALAQSMRMSNAERTGLEAIWKGLRATAQFPDTTHSLRRFAIDRGDDEARLILATLFLVATNTRERAAVGATEAFETSLTWLRNWTRPEFPVTGADLIALGYRPGRELGDALTQLRQAWVESDFSISRETLLARLQRP